MNLYLNDEDREVLYNAIAYAKQEYGDSGNEIYLKDIQILDKITKRMYKKRLDYRQFFKNHD